MAYKKLKFWFDEELSELLIKKIATVDATLALDDFSNTISNKIEHLELKDRVEIFADELHNIFSNDYEKGIRILLNILGPENENETGMFKEYYWIMPIAKYVEKYGLQNVPISLKAIEEITKRNTGEYAIRPFIEMHFDATMHQMYHWSKSSNKHVRRLSSEGVRPRLPWAKKLTIFIENPNKIIPILDNLKDDTSKYVQKSVANCLNDIFKDNYKTGKTIVETWNVNNIDKERKWIIKHSLRNLLKAKDEWAIKMITKFA